MIPSTSRRALLDIIEEKERELSRIRNAAENVVEEEKTSLQQQLSALESEMEHNASLLRDREEKIRSLENEIRFMEEKRVQQLREMEENMQFEMSRRVLRIEDDLKQESKKRSEEFEQDLRKKVKIEFEERFQQSETSLHSHYMNKVTKELENQERELRMLFEQNILHLKSGFEQEESEWISKLRRKDQHIEELTLKMDKVRSRREKELEEELERQYQIEIQRKIELHDKRNHSIIEKLSEENSKLRHQCGMLEDNVMDANKERSMLDSKLHELLGILQSVELTYEEKAKYHEDEIRKFTQRIRELDDIISCKERDSKKVVTSLNDELYQTKRRHKMEKSAQMRAINGLKRDLNASLVKHAKLEGSFRVKLQEIQQSKSKLENNIRILSKELHELKEENLKLHQQLYVSESQNKSLESSNVQLKLSHAEEKKKLLETLENTSQEEQDKLRNKLSRAIRERDDAISEKDHLLATRRKEIINQESCSNAEAESLRHELVQLTSQLERTKLIADKKASESEHLKSVVASMRKEMERMTIDASGKYTCVTNGNECDIRESLDELKKFMSLLLQKHKDISSDQSKKNFDKKLKELETKLLTLCDGFNAVSSERDNLSSISSRLRSEVTQMKTGDIHKTAFQRPEKDKLTSAGPDSTVDGVNIHDFAQAVWSQAMIPMPRQVRKSSERSTRSQEECLEKLKREQKKNSTIFKSEVKVRNWNDKDD